MSVNATHQARSGIRPRTKQDFKIKLLKEHFPDLRNPEGWAENLHFIDTSLPGAVRIATKDGGHVEIRDRLAKVFGQHGLADALVDALRTADDLDDIERLEELKCLRRKGNGVRPKRNPDEVPNIPIDRLEAIADRWRSRGFTRVTQSPDGVWVEIGKCRIQDLGDELRIHGPGVSNAAVRAMLAKAVDEWDSSLEVFGSPDFKDSTWLEAQRQGVVVYDADTGQLYEPSEEVRKKLEGDAARVRSESEELSSLKNQKAIAAVLQEAAAGDTAALKKLLANDSDLANFVGLHLDDEQRKRVVGKPEADVVAALPEFRVFGRIARRTEEEKRNRPDFAPDYHLTPEEFDESAPETRRPT